MKYIYWLKDANDADKLIVGYKAWALGLLLKEGLNVPKGFILTSDAFSLFLESNGILKEIKELCSSLSLGVSVSEVSLAIQELILGAKFSSELMQDIQDHYEIFGALESESLGGLSLGLSKESDIGVAEGLVSGSEATVAVRLSCENPKLKSKAKLAVSGSENLFSAIKNLIGQYYSVENLKKNKGEGFAAILVQQMVNSQKSGVVFTKHPVTGEKEKSVIEAVWGLGTTLYDQEIAADSYVVNNSPREVVSREVDLQDQADYFQEGKIVRRQVDKLDKESQTLTDRECLEITRQGQKAQRILGVNCDARFSIIGEEMYLLCAKEMEKENGQSLRDIADNVSESKEIEEISEVQEDCKAQEASETEEMIEVEEEKKVEDEILLEETNEVDNELDNEIENENQETKDHFVTNIIPKSEAQLEVLGALEGEDEETDEAEESDESIEDDEFDETEGEESESQEESYETNESEGASSVEEDESAGEQEESNDDSEDTSDEVSASDNLNYKKNIPKYPSFKKKGKFGRNIYRRR